MTPRHGSDPDDHRWAAWAAQQGDPRGDATRGYETRGYDARGQENRDYNSGRDQRSRSSDWFGAPGADEFAEPAEPRLFRDDYRRPDPPMDPRRGDSGRGGQRDPRRDDPRLDDPRRGGRREDARGDDRGRVDPTGLPDRSAGYGRPDFDRRDPYQTAHLPNEPGGPPLAPSGAEPPPAGRAGARPDPRAGARAASRSNQRSTPTDSATPGLGALAAFLLVLGLSIACGVTNAFVLDKIGPVFAAGFLIGTLYVACRIRYEELLGALIIPPIAFATALAVAGLFLEGSASGGFLTQRVIDTGTELATKAPLLFAGEGIAALIVLVRWLRNRRDRPSTLTPGRPLA